MSREKRLVIHMERVVANALMIRLMGNIDGLVSINHSKEMEIDSFDR